MHWIAGCLLGLVAAAALAAAPASPPRPTFTVATFNLENYLDLPLGSRPAKSEAARAKIRESIRSLNPDVLALQEIGSTNALCELQASLKREGLDLPHWEHVAGWDTNIFVGVLSRYPFAARRPHSRENFLLRGRRFQVSRGFAEVDIQVNAQYVFTLITAHLKSRRPVASADEAELREQEALRLREKIDAVLRRRPDANLVVLGDFNDTKDTPPLRAVLGQGRQALVDTRPAERNGDAEPNPNPRFEPRRVTWTHYYGKADSYDRVDYILLSPAMAREWDRTGTYVLALPDWGLASDHRPLVARFFAQDR